jgi:hypothetical protein
MSREKRYKVLAFGAGSLGSLAPSEEHSAGGRTPGEDRMHAHLGEMAAAGG